MASFVCAPNASGVALLVSAAPAIGPSRAAILPPLGEA
jgi:hypothetical protein